MAKQTDRRLVIDADIARSAGESEHPVSRASRRFLETMLKVGHMVVMTKAITEEWRRHRSGFSKTWLVQMYGRRKVHRCNAEHDEDLRNRIAAAVPVNRSQAAEKDVHLIEAARRTDRLIASRDQQARSVFRAVQGRPEACHRGGRGAPRRRGAVGSRRRRSAGGCPVIGAAR